MGDGARTGTPRWILVATGVVALAAASLVLVVRYYEIRKARAEAERAEAAHREPEAPAARPRVPAPAPVTPTPQPPTPLAGDSTARDRVLTGHTGRVWCLAVSPDGTTAVSGGADHAARVWDLRTGSPGRVFAGHTDLVRHVAFSPDGGRVVTAGWDNTARIWELATGRAQTVFRGHTDKLAGVAFAAGGEDVLSCAADGKVLRWRTDGGAVVRTYPSPDAQLWAVAVHPGVNLLAASGLGKATPPAGELNQLRLWDFDTGRPRPTLPALPHGLHSLDVSPDGRTLVGGGSTGQAIVWDVPTRREVTRFPGHAVRFSPDGNRLAVGNNDGTVVVRDVRSWAEVHRFTGHTDIAQGVGFGVGGRSVVSGSWDGTVRVWHLPH